MYSLSYIAVTMATSNNNNDNNNEVYWYFETFEQKKRKWSHTFCQTSAILIAAAKFFAIIWTSGRIYFKKNLKISGQKPYLFKSYFNETNGRVQKPTVGSGLKKLLNNLLEIAALVLEIKFSMRWNQINFLVYGQGSKKIRSVGRKNKKNIIWFLGSVSFKK